MVQETIYYKLQYELAYATQTFAFKICWINPEQWSQREIFDPNYNKLILYEPVHGVRTYLFNKQAHQWLTFTRMYCGDHQRKYRWK